MDSLTACHRSSSTGHEEQPVSLSLPRSALDLGTPPRLCYPLVVFLVRGDAADAEPGRDLHPDESVALVNVVHIKDSVCTLPTSILAQYLKQANGQLSCLKVREGGGGGGAARAGAASGVRRPHNTLLGYVLFCT